MSADKPDLTRRPDAIRDLIRAATAIKDDLAQPESEERDADLANDLGFLIAVVSTINGGDVYDRHLALIKTLTEALEHARPWVDVVRKCAGSSDAFASLGEIDAALKLAKESADG